MGMTTRMKIRIAATKFFFRRDQLDKLDFLSCASADIRVADSMRLPWSCDSHLAGLQIIIIALDSKVHKTILYPEIYTSHDMEHCNQVFHLEYDLS